MIYLERIIHPIEKRTVDACQEGPQMYEEPNDSAIIPEGHAPARRYGLEVSNCPKALVVGYE